MEINSNSDIGADNFWDSSIFFLDPSRLDVITKKLEEYKQTNCEIPDQCYSRLLETIQLISSQSNETVEGLPVPCQKFLIAWVKFCATRCSELPFSFLESVLIFIFDSPNKSWLILRPNVTSFTTLMLKSFLDDGGFSNLINRILLTQTTFVELRKIATYFLSFVEWLKGSKIPFPSADLVEQLYVATTQTIEAMGENDCGLMSINKSNSHHSKLKDADLIDVFHIFRLIQETDKKYGLYLTLNYFKTNLEFCVIWLKLPYIQKKIHALSEINSICVKSEWNDQYCRLLSEIIINEKIITLLFQNNTSPEIVKKSMPLLQFMMHNGIFSKSDVDVIWESSVQHESTMHEMWVLFLELKPVLRTEMKKLSSEQIKIQVEEDFPYQPQLDLLDHLFRKMMNIESKFYEKSFIDLTRKITSHAVNILSVGANKGIIMDWYGLEFLWEHTFSNQDLLQKHFENALIGCLRFKTFEIQRIPLVLRCLNNIKQNRYVQISLSFIKTILEYYPTKKQLELINWLHSIGRENNLMAVIFTCLNEMLDETEKVHEDYFCMMICVFDFISYFLPKTGIRNQLGKNEIDILWRHLVYSDSLLQISSKSEENFNLFSQFEQLLYKNPDSVSPSNLEYIFTTKFMSIQIERMSPPSFSLFEVLFRKCNLEKGKLAILKEDEDYCILAFDLFGLDRLWKIAFHVISSVVATDAINLLANTQKNFHKSLLNGITLQRESNLKLCMDKLKTEADPLVINRSFEIIHRFLSFEVDSDFYDPSQEHNYQGPSMRKFKISYLPLDIIAISLASKEFYIQIEDNATVESLRLLICQTGKDLGYLQEDPSKLILKLCKGTQSDFLSNMATRIYRLPACDHISVSKSISTKTPPTTLSFLPKPPSLKSPEPYSSLLLKTYFHDLFNKFTLQPHLCQSVWGLLMKLPTDTKMKEYFISLDDKTNWDFLDTKNIYQLCYYLQIIEIIWRTKATPEWEQSFISNRGLEYFINTLLISNGSLLSMSHTSIHMKSMRLLLKTIHHLLLEQNEDLSLSINPIVVASINVNFDIFLFKLMEVSHLVSQDLVNEEKFDFSSFNKNESELATGIVSDVMDLIEAIIEIDDGVKTSFFQSNELFSCCLSCLCSSQPIRLRVTNSLIRMCKNLDNTNESRDLIQSFYFNLVQSLQSFSSKEIYHQLMYQTNEYFQLLNEVIKIVNLHDDNNNNTVLILKPIQQLLNFAHFMEEKHDPFYIATNHVRQDTIYMGLIRILLTLFQLHSIEMNEVIIQEIFEVALFANGDPNTSIKCQQDYEISVEMSDNFVFEQERQVQAKEGDELFIISNPKKRRIIPFELQQQQRAKKLKVDDFIEASVLMPKCKSKEARELAFKFLLDLSEEGSENFVKILEKTIAVQKAINYSNPKWDISPDNLTRSNSGFVGLTNLGSTCYMNSLFQQLFMIDEYCERILSLSCPQEEASILYQLQLMMANIKTGLKRSYSTRSFCSANKDSNGKEMKTEVQMDVDEFQKLWFDKLEGLLKGTPQEKLLTELFGGEVINEITSLECPHIAQRIEPFFSLSLEVKNLGTLEESLASFVLSDLLEGENKFHCSECNEKVAAKKRCLLKSLPKNLIIQLKRFDYDVEFEFRSKVSQFFEFPEVLNLDPFTVEGISRKENETKRANIGGTGKSEPEMRYRLVGILVHKGQAESGHYYSFIKERKTQIWYQFNDEYVTLFDPKLIPLECYGGQISPGESRSNSAYMLFYEKFDLVEHFKDDSRITIPQHLNQTVMQENKKFLSEKNLFEVNFFHFVQQIISKSGSNLNAQERDRIFLLQTKLAIHFVIRILFHCRTSKEQISYLTLSITNLMTIFPHGCSWFLKKLFKKKNTWFDEMFRLCPHVDARDSFLTIVTYALSSLENTEENLLLSSLTYLMQIVDSQLAACRLYSQFWVIFQKLSLIQDLQSRMIGSGLLQKLIYISAYYTKNLATGNTNLRLMFALSMKDQLKCEEELLKVISGLILHCEMNENSGALRDTSEIMMKTNFFLSVVDHVEKKVLAEKNNPTGIAVASKEATCVQKIICSLCKEKICFEMILLHLISAICTEKSKGALEYLSILIKPIFFIDDIYQSERIRQIVHTILIIITDTHREDFVLFLTDLCSLVHSPEILEMLKSCLFEKIELLCGWMLTSSSRIDLQVLSSVLSRRLPHNEITLKKLGDYFKRTQIKKEIQPVSVGEMKIFFQPFFQILIGCIYNCDPVIITDFVCGNMAELYFYFEKRDPTISQNIQDLYDFIHIIVLGIVKTKLGDTLELDRAMCNFAKNLVSMTISCCSSEKLRLQKQLLLLESTYEVVNLLSSHKEMVDTFVKDTCHMIWLFKYYLFDPKVWLLDLDSAKMSQFSKFLFQFAFKDEKFNGVTVPELLTFYGTEKPSLLDNILKNKNLGNRFYSAWLEMIKYSSLETRFTFFNFRGWLLFGNYNELLGEIIDNFVESKSASNLGKDIMNDFAKWLLGQSDYLIEHKKLNDNFFQLLNNVIKLEPNCNPSIIKLLQHLSNKGFGTKILSMHFELQTPNYSHQSNIVPDPVVNLREVNDSNNAISISETEDESEESEKSS